MSMQSLSSSQAGGSHFIATGNERTALEIQETLLDYHDGHWALCALDSAHPPAFAGAGLRPTAAALAELIVARIRDRRSLDFQCAAMVQQGIMLSRTTLTRWITLAARALAPLAEAIAEKGRQSPIIFAANAPIGRGYSAGQRLWIYSAPLIAATADRGGHPGLVWLRMTPDRTGGYAAQELSQFIGTLQADQNAGYDRFARDTKRVMAGCWASLVEQASKLAHRSADPLPDNVIASISQLRAIEAECRNASAAERLAQRHRRSLPIVLALEADLARCRESREPASLLEQFARAMTDDWPSLTMFLNNGSVELFNPARRRLEELLSPNGRWLFGRNQISRNSAITLIALVESCVLNRVDPRHYLARRIASSAAGDGKDSLPIIMPWEP